MNTNNLPESLKPKSSILIEAQSLSKKLQRKVILHDVNFDISRNEIVTIIGPNGSGKTTLLRCLIGLIKPDAGRIRRKRGLKIGYVPQHVHFEATFPMSVQYFLKIANKHHIDVPKIIEMMKIAPLLKKQMRHLSGGELQRVLLAQALLGSPELLVLDEPVQGVDFAGQAELYKLIRKVSHERGCAVLMVSHDLHLVMADTDRVICMNGHVCCSGTPHSVSRDPAFVELFGEEAAKQTALYVHHHDHEHNMDGDVTACKGGNSC